MKDNDLYNLAFEMGMKDCSLGIDHGKKFQNNFLQDAYTSGYGHAYEVEQIVSSKLEEIYK